MTANQVQQIIKDELDKMIDEAKTMQEIARLCNPNFVNQYTQQRIKEINNE